MAIAMPVPITVSITTNPIAIAIPSAIGIQH